MADNDLHRLMLLVTAEQHRWLKGKSYSEGRSMSLIVRELIEEARRRDPEPVPPRRRFNG